MEDAHTKTVDEVLKYFGTDQEKGLTPDQVRKYQDKYGPNGELMWLKIITQSI